MAASSTAGGQSSGLFVRIAGVAGILTAVLMLAGYAFHDPNAPSPFLLIDNIVGIIFVLGLYLVYRHDSASLSVVAVAAALLGYILFLTISNTVMDPAHPSTTMLAADILANIVGVALFSWLALSTGRMARALAIAGLVAVAGGVMAYTLNLGAGVPFEGGSGAVAGLMAVFFYVYFLVLVVWQIWTGVVLALGRVKSAPA